MDEAFKAVIHGVRAAQAELTAMDKRVDAATIAALKKVQSLARARIRSRLRGRARWNHRGQATQGPWTFVPGFDLPGSRTVHISRAGGPGRFTGTLNSDVKASRKPRREGKGTYTAVVMMGSKTSPIANVYKRRLEAKYPYFAPGVNSAEPLMPAVWEAAWAKAIATKK